MHIQNLNNEQIIIRHNTIIDEDDLFSTIYLQQINPSLSPENYIVPDNDEIERNPRSRSAKLRIAEKL